MPLPELYSRFTNFFELKEIKTGRLYETGEAFREDGVTIEYQGRAISCVPSFGSTEVPRDSGIIRSFLAGAFEKNLASAGYIRRHRYVFYHPTEEISHPNKDIYAVFNGFEYRIVSLSEGFALCINPKLVALYKQSLQSLFALGVQADLLIGAQVVWLIGGQARKGRLIGLNKSSGQPTCRVFDKVTELVIDVDPAGLNLEGLKNNIGVVLLALHREDNFVKLLRKYSFLDDYAAPKERYSRTSGIISTLSRLFPLRFGDFEFELLDTPVPVSP